MVSQHGGNRTTLTDIEVAPKLYTAGGTNGAGVDMQGWDGVVFEANIGAMVAGSTFDMRAVGSANSNYSGAVNITGAAITQVPNTQNGIMASIDVWRPTNRYVRTVSTVAVDNVNYGITSRRYRYTGRSPVSLPTNYQYVNVAEN